MADEQDDTVPYSKSVRDLVKNLTKIIQEIGRDIASLAQSKRDRVSVIHLQEEKTIKCKGDTLVMTPCSFTVADSNSFVDGQKLTVVNTANGAISVKVPGSGPWVNVNAYCAAVWYYSENEGWLYAKA